ncbi:hypothetical protein KBZ10_17680 [Streptomyces sp. F63]|nr:hypothetical protein [Streptomyces sp. F63]
MGVAAAAIAAALLLTGCGNGSDGGKDDSKSGLTSGSTAGREDGSTGDGTAAGGAPAAGEVSGTYVAKLDTSEPIVLSITGNKAVLAGPHACSGDYTRDLLMLECPDGNTDRTMGAVTVSDGGKTLKVDWDTLSDAEDDTFTKAASPEDLPKGLPTELPTELPGTDG